MKKDPVCGMGVNEKKSDSYTHRGQKYYFCSPTCKWAFERNPENFIKK